MILYSDTEAQHIQDVEKVFKARNNAGLKMKIENWFFQLQEMNLLGFKYTHKRMAPYEERCKAIQNVIVPHDLTGMLRVLGMPRCYQRFDPL